MSFYNVGVDTAKDAIYGRLRIGRSDDPDAPAPGYVHLPMSIQANVVAQMVSEIVVVDMVKGRPVRRWKLPSGARNEALDCAVYALAAKESLGKRMHSRSSRAAVKEAEHEHVPVPQAEVIAKVEAPRAPHRRQRWGAYR